MSLPINLVDTRNRGGHHKEIEDRHLDLQSHWQTYSSFVPYHLPYRGMDPTVDHQQSTAQTSIYHPTPIPSYNGGVYSDFFYHNYIHPMYLNNSNLRQNYHYPAVSDLTLEHFELYNTLGTGTFGRVYLCRLRQALPPVCSSRSTSNQCNPVGGSLFEENSTSYNEPSDFFALKMMSKREVLRLKQLEHVFSEKSILFSSSHPFIIRLHSTFQNQRYVFMLLEYAPGGELFSYLKKFSRFPLDVTRFYAAEIVLALEYLHSRNIVFRDLKPENLLLDAKGHIKIADFGFAKMLQESMTWTLCGTPEYLAPEIIQGQGHSKEVDWWALGILIFEMLVGFPPFYDTNPFQIYEKILAGQIVFPDWFDEDTRSLISHLLVADRRERLGSSFSAGGSLDVKRHPWFSGVDWNAYYWRKIPPPIRPVVNFSGDSANFERYPEVRPEPIPPWEVDPFHHLFVGF